MLNPTITNSVTLYSSNKIFKGVLKNALGVSFLIRISLKLFISLSNSPQSSCFIMKIGKFSFLNSSPIANILFLVSHPFSPFKNFLCTSIINKPFIYSTSTDSKIIYFIYLAIFNLYYHLWKIITIYILYIIKVVSLFHH